MRAEPEALQSLLFWSRIIGSAYFFGACFVAVVLASGAAEVPNDFWLIDVLVLLYLLAAAGILLSVFALAAHAFSRPALVAFLLNATGLALLLLLPLIESRS